jgi:hypothetical protein
MPDAPRRRARWVAPTVIALVVIVIAGVFGARYLSAQPDEPKTVATHFWRLLAQGKAEEALALTSTPPAPNGLLLTDAVYGKADRGIADVEARQVMKHGDEASVTIAYTLHDKPQTAQVDLVAVHRGFLLPPSWQITNAPLAKISATVATNGNADALSVNGSALPVPGDGTIAIPALPGAYEFALADSHGLFSPEPQTVTVAGAPVAVKLGLAPTSKLGTQAVAQATAMVNGCFTKPTLTADCPIAPGIRGIFDLIAEQSVTYRLTRAPKLAFDAKAMRVSSTSDGEIVATGSDPNLGTFRNTAQVSFTLDVTVKDGKLVLTPYDGGVHNTNLVLSSRD